MYECGQLSYDPLRRDMFYELCFWIFRGGNNAYVFCSLVEQYDVSKLHGASMLLPWDRMACPWFLSDIFSNKQCCLRKFMCKPDTDV